MARIIQHPEILCKVVSRLKSAGMKIVTTNGCFDLLHRAHIHILRNAKAQGDILIVGLNSDISVRLNKGGKRPILPQTERAEILSSFEMVDYVYLFDEKDCINFVRLASPDVHVNDASYGEACIESDAVNKCKGRLYLVEKIPSPSTSSIIESIQKS